MKPARKKGVTLLVKNDGGFEEGKEVVWSVVGVWERCEEGGVLEGLEDIALALWLCVDLWVGLKGWGIVPGGDCRYSILGKGSN